MTWRRRVLVWIRICREAWSMLGNISGQEPADGAFRVAVRPDGDADPGTTNPEYVLKPDAAVVNIARGVRETTKSADWYRTYEPDGTHETIILAYGRRAPTLVTA